MKSPPNVLRAPGGGEGRISDSTARDAGPRAFPHDRPERTEGHRGAPIDHREERVRPGARVAAGGPVVYPRGENGIEAARELTSKGTQPVLRYLTDARKILGGMPEAKDCACITASHELDTMCELVRAAVDHYGKEVFPFELVESNGGE
eukprot:3736327-Prymnesium_polylepis.1